MLLPSTSCVLIYGCPTQINQFKTYVIFLIWLLNFFKFTFIIFFFLFYWSLFDFAQKAVICRKYICYECSALSKTNVFKISSRAFIIHPCILIYLDPGLSVSREIRYRLLNLYIHCTSCIINIYVLQFIKHCFK